MKVSGRSYKNSTALRIRAMRERAIAMNRARWKRHREEIDRRISDGDLVPVEPAIRPGDLRGIFQWTDSSGRVRRWTIRHASRVNSLRIDGVPGEHGLAWFLDKLRRKILSHSDPQ